MNFDLSVVVAARNDDYGGRFLPRFNRFLATLDAWADCHVIATELIVVEWNPPTDKPRLFDAARLPRGQKLKLQLLTVSPEIHRTFENSARIPLFEYLAKNVGIRRASGRFVLATNPDIILSDGIGRRIGKGRLRDDCFYRTDRHDVLAPVPEELDYRQAQKFCESYAVRVHDLEGLIDLSTATLRRQYRQRLWKRMFVEQYRRLNGSQIPARIHTRASGDFLLMSRESWHRQRGYPEFKTHSYIDGYGCYLAAAHGLRQVIFSQPDVIYHQEHDRAGVSERPWTDYELFRAQAQQMLNEKKPLVFNAEDWGLGSIDSLALPVTAS